MREAVMLRLEQLSYYTHLSLTGGIERPILAYRVIDIRGSRFHVLSRIRDAGLDFTGRTNFIAHHLVVSPEEIPQLPTPAVILRDWPGWLDSWNGEPQQLSSENWGNLGLLAERTNLPARTWQSLTGDAANGFALLEANPGTCLCADGTPEKMVLSLAVESMELLELRDARRDYRVAAWQYTFTTSMQEQDNPGDFRWRLVHRDNPAFTKFAGAGCASLTSLRTSQCAPDEEAFARGGWQKPTRVAITPAGASITEGETLSLKATADGIPSPRFRWFEIQQGMPVELVGEAGPTLEQQPEGRSKRYKVRANNRVGSVDSPVVEVSIRQAYRIEPLLVRPKVEGRAQQRGHRTIEVLLATPFGCRSNIADFRDTFAMHVFSRRNPTSKALEEITFDLNDSAAGIQERLGEIPQENADVIQSCKDGLHKLQRRNRRLHRIARSLQMVVALAPVTIAVWLGYLKPIHRTGFAKRKGDSPPVLAMNTNGAPLQAGPLPRAWVAVEVGKVNPKLCSNNLADTAFSIRGAGHIGTSDFSQPQRDDERQDAFHFVYQARLASNSISAWLLKVNPESSHSLCGLMLRWSEAPGAPFVFIGKSSAKIKSICRRAENQGCQSAETDLPGKQAIFLRIYHDAGHFVTEYRYGEEWIAIRPYGDFMQSPPGQTEGYMAGFAVSSGSLTGSVQAIFKDVSIDTQAPSIERERPQTDNPTPQR